MAFIAALANDMPILTAMIFASAGNLLGITLNYWLGYWLYSKTEIKLKKSRVGTKSLEYGDRYGYLILLFSWLPVIGDPLTLVAGLMRLRFIYFIVIAGVLRILRYYFLSLMV